MENGMMAIHPGEFLAEILEDLNMSQAEFARRIGACNDFCGHLSEIGRNPFSKFNTEPVQS